MVLFGATLHDHDRRPFPPTMQSRLQLLAFVTLFLGCTASSQCRAGYGCYRISAAQGACVPL
jgi:hypothetical protein